MWKRLSCKLNMKTSLSRGFNSAHMISLDLMSLSVSNMEDDLQILEQMSLDELEAKFWHWRRGCRNHKMETTLMRTLKLGSVLTERAGEHQGGSLFPSPLKMKQRFAICH
jgi:hypothetical protein